MELVLILIILVGIGYIYVRSRSISNQQLTAQRSAVDGVRSAAEEDVTRLGEEVAALDTSTAGHDLDEATRQDYQQALDSYDHAKEALARIERPADVTRVTEALEDGRYAITCVKARLAGDPLPTRRPPCFFNPQHGPSTDDVEWAPPGGVKRSVPACAADAERVRAGAEPITRKVLASDGSRKPYWEAGPAYAPWARGYYSSYAGSGLLPGVLVGAMLTGGFGSWDSGYGAGYTDGIDAGDGGDVRGDVGGDVGGDAGGTDSGDGSAGDTSDFDAGDSWPGGDMGGDMGGDFGGGDFGGFDF